MSMVGNPLNCPGLDCDEFLMWIPHTPQVARQEKTKGPTLRKSDPKGTHQICPKPAQVPPAGKTFTTLAEAPRGFFKGFNTF